MEGESSVVCVYLVINSFVLLQFVSRCFGNPLCTLDSDAEEREY